MTVVSAQAQKRSKRERRRDCILPKGKCVVGGDASGQGHIFQRSVRGKGAGDSEKMAGAGGNKEERGVRACEGRKEGDGRRGWSIYIKGFWWRNRKGDDEMSQID